MLTSIITNPKERTRFLKFSAVGIIGAVVDFGTFNLLTLVFQVPAVIASVVSFIAAVISNFTWNRFWTYPDARSKSFRKQWTQFFIINMIGLLIRTPLFAWMEIVLVEAFSPLSLLDFVSSTFLAHNLALAIAVIVVMFWNFFANRYWTYNDVE